MDRAQEFVGRLMQGRNVAHLAHWNVESGYHHQVLGEFYDELTDLFDSFAEQYMGYYGKRVNPKVPATEYNGGIADALENELEWIEKYRYEVCSRDETALQNTIDEIVHLYQSIQFKLRMLK